MKFFLYAFSAFLLFGCNSTKLASNKDPQFTKKLTSLHILIRGSESSDVYLYALADHLRDQLKAKGIAVTAERPNRLSLETEADMFNRIRKSNPDAILIIDQTEVRKTANNYSLGTHAVGATLDLKMVDTGSEKLVWRASLKSDSQLGQGAAAKSSGKRIIEKMVADQLIP